MDSLTGFGFFIKRPVMLFLNNPTLLTQYVQAYNKQYGTNYQMNESTPWMLSTQDDFGITCQPYLNNQVVSEAAFYFPWTAITGIFHTPSIGKLARAS